MFDTGGAYDAECRLARIACQAEGVVLLVLNGARGDSFEVQGPPEMVSELPRVLRETADQIEQQLKARRQ